jgi:hypothetical protein
METLMCPELAHGLLTGLDRPGLYLWEQVWLTRIGPDRRELVRKRLRAFTRPIVGVVMKRTTPRSRMILIVRRMVTSVAVQSRRRVTRPSTRARTVAEERTEG